jgi:hypothetical protein
MNFSYVVNQRGAVQGREEKKLSGDAGRVVMRVCVKSSPNPCLELSLCWGESCTDHQSESPSGNTSQTNKQQLTMNIIQW